MAVVLGTLSGCKHSEPLPSERLYMAAIAPASERSLGPMPDHVPEPDRGEENKPENVPTHGPEHGPEGRPENVPADQMPVEPGPEPGPEMAPFRGQNGSQKRAGIWLKTGPGNVPEMNLNSQNDQIGPKWTGSEI